MWGVKKTHSAIKLDTNPKHVHTCITTHAVWHVSYGSVCETHDIWHISLHVSCGTSCDPGVPWLRHIRHCADIIPRQLQVIAIWRSRDFKIEIPRLQDLEIVTSEIVKYVNCEYCGAVRILMRVSQKNDFFIRCTQCHLAIFNGSRRI